MQTATYSASLSLPIELPLLSTTPHWCSVSDDGAALHDDTTGLHLRFRTEDGIDPATLTTTLAANTAMAYVRSESVRLAEIERGERPAADLIDLARRAARAATAEACATQELLALGRPPATAMTLMIRCGGHCTVVTIDDLGAEILAVPRVLYP